MKKFKKLLVLSLAALLMPVNPLAAATADIIQVRNQDWQEFYSVAGKCTLMFPNSPEHITERMVVPEEGYDLKYDAYISNHDEKNVYLLLVAQYPKFVDQSLAHTSLEGFLNGILANNPGNQLLFADMLLIEGKPALDFFIRTGGVYFKGRALMVANQLYLMAMECEVQNYDETRYNFFVTSFKFNKR